VLSVSAGRDVISGFSNEELKGVLGKSNRADFKISGNYTDPKFPGELDLYGRVGIRFTNRFDPHGKYLDTICWVNPDGGQESFEWIPIKTYTPIEIVGIGDQSLFIVYRTDLGDFQGDR
jgi:hypothetical protein